MMYVLIEAAQLTLDHLAYHGFRAPGHQQLQATKIQPYLRIKMRKMICLHPDARLLSARYVYSFLFCTKPENFL
jgi:hypothetical protein